MPVLLRRCRVIAALPLLLGAPTLGAQQPVVVTGQAPLPGVGATRAAGRITIDARPDEAAWAEAKPITAFRQSRPNEGQPSTLRTEVRILFDDDALYVGARLYEPQGAAGIRAP